MRISMLALVSAVALVSGSASAQTSATPPGTIDESKPKPESNRAATPEPDKSLSEKLKENEGVIKPPPAVDREIRKAPPETPGEKMPVIIPPGEPGGNPSVQPK